jgi:hypothetical protein
MPAATAQSHATAERSSDLSTFGSAGYAAPAYGHAKNLGVTGGFNYTRLFSTPVLPSFEFRAVYSTGASVAEREMLSGIRLQTHIRRTHPYVDFLVGPGKIIFAHPTSTYTFDTSTVYNYGGGLDWIVNKHLSARVDYQQQHWNIGGKPVTIFYPGALTVGAIYSIPFPSHHSM